jgi:hypothetical protein
VTSPHPYRGPQPAVISLAYKTLIILEIPRDLRSLCQALETNTKNYVLLSQNLYSQIVRRSMNEE